MKTSRLLLLLPLLFLLSPLHATILRTYVSSGGDDTKDCSLATPCQTLQTAVNKTTAGGEVDILNTGDFGSALITKAITVDGGHDLAYVHDILVDVASSLVVLRNLTITETAGNVGILNIQTTLRIEHVTIIGQTQMLYGVECQSGTCSLDDVRILNAKSVGLGAGFYCHGVAVKGFISNSVVQNSDTGILSSNSGVIQVDNTIVQMNTTGVTANAATVRLSNTTITDNTTGISFTGVSPLLVSWNNNRIFYNTVNGNPTLTINQR